MNDDSFQDFPFEQPRENLPTKRKAFGYILRRDRVGRYGLLAYTTEEIHPRYRIPGGNLDKGEKPLDAMFREVEEESGFRPDDLKILRLLGEVEYYKPYIDKNVYRHDYLLLAPPHTADTWDYVVQGHGNDAGTTFYYRFLSPDEVSSIDEELATYVTPEYMPEFFAVENKSVVIVDYDPAWAAQFVVARDMILDEVGEHIIAVEHIGSTSVHDLAAKPIIDILITVESLDEADAHVVQKLIDLGYQYVPEHEATMPQRRYFRGFDADGQVIEHIHLFEDAHEEVDKHLRFRDYLRTHPEARDAYASLKRHLAATLTRAEYTEAKTDFVMDILRRA